MYINGYFSMPIDLTASVSHWRGRCLKGPGPQSFGPKTNHPRCCDSTSTACVPHRHTPPSACPSTARHLALAQGLGQPRTPSRTHQALRQALCRVVHVFRPRRSNGSSCPIRFQPQLAEIALRRLTSCDRSQPCNTSCFTPTFV